MDATLWKDTLVQTFREYGEDKVSRHAAALSYYAVFSLPPLLIISLAIASQFIDAQTAQDALMNQATGLVGDTGAQAIGDILANASHPSRTAIATAVSVVTLLWGASGVFTQLTDSINTIWEREPKAGQGIIATIRGRFFSFSMVLVLGFLLLVSLILGTVLSGVTRWVGGLVSDAAIVAQVLNLIAGFGVTTALFALIFKYVPDVEIKWRDVMVGAVATALLFTIGRWLIGMYIGRSAPASAYGAAGSLIVILLWIYYSAQILFLGAEFTQVYAHNFGSRQADTTAAQSQLPDAELLRRGIPIDVFRRNQEAQS